MCRADAKAFPFPFSRPGVRSRREAETWIHERQLGKLLLFVFDMHYLLSFLFLCTNPITSFLFYVQVNVPIWSSLIILQLLNLPTKRNVN